jgi:hypothetical protein
MQLIPRWDWNEFTSDSRVHAFYRFDAKNGRQVTRVIPRTLRPLELAIEIRSITPELSIDGSAQVEPVFKFDRHASVAQSRAYTYEHKNCSASPQDHLLETLTQVSEPADGSPPVDGVMVLHCRP